MVPVFPRFAGGNNELCAHSTQNKGTNLEGHLTPADRRDADVRRHFRVSELLLLLLSWPIMPCDASWGDALCEKCDFWLKIASRRTPMHLIDTPQHLGVVESDQPKLHMHSKLTKWNNMGL